MRSRIAPTCLRALLWTAILVADAPVAHASSLNEIYVVASKLDLLPNPNAATSVMIHGAFFFYTNNGQYTVPKCGYMYFTCPPGSEAMCRQQWTDILNFGQNNQCAGFGQQFVMTTATFYNEGVAPGKPDLWDLGMGVGVGGWVDGKCDPAKMLNCGGVQRPDMAVTQPPDLSMPPPPADLSSPPPPPDLSKLPGPADMAMQPPPRDLSRPPEVVAPKGCAVGGNGAGPWSILSLGLPLGLLLGLAALRRRR